MRIHQDNNFEIIAFNGLQIDKLLVCYDADKTENLLAIYLKILNKKWQFFFLDAEIGFWEKREYIDDEDFHLVDETNKFNIKGKLIKRIYCKPDMANSKITILLKNQKLHLQCKNAKIFDDSNNEFVKEIICNEKI